MAKSHKYEVNLDLTQSVESKRAIAHLNATLENCEESLENLHETYVSIAETSEDVNRLTDAYEKGIKKTIGLKDREIDQLIKEQALIEDVSSEEYKALTARIKGLEADKAKIKHDAVHYKALVKEAQLKKKFKDFFDLKAGVSSIKAQIKEFGNLAKSLKTVEGRFAALNKVKAAFTSASASMGKIGKASLKGLAGVAGAGAAVAGAAISQAGAQADKENALKALKNADESDADAVFVQTGADYSTIVNAINKLSSKFKGDDLIAAAVQEIKNPGFASVLMASNRINASSLASVLDQIKKSSGSQDLSAAMAASKNARSVTRGAVSQADYISAYASLQNAGIDEEHINRIISSVARKGGDFVEEFNKTDLSRYVRGQAKNRIQGLKLEKIDPTKETSKSASERLIESMNRIQLVKDRLMVKVMPKVAEIVEKVLGSQSFGKLIESAGRFIDLIMPVLDRVLTSIMPIVERILPPLLTALEPMINIVVSKVAPMLEWISEKVSPILDGASRFIEWIFSGKVGESIADAFSSFWDKTLKPALNAALKFITSPFINIANTVIDAINSIEVFGKKLVSSPIEKVGFPQFAQGGIARTPSICGEAGSELVLPLNNPARANSIVTNYNTTQNFSLSGTQSPLSLSQAVQSQRYIRQINKW